MTFIFFPKSNNAASMESALVPERVPMYRFDSFT